ncbi:MAG: serine acetyltransferase [Clostridiales bacterium]|nr:serine acetyltransferase [Clostridiales bacterium]
MIRSKKDLAYYLNEDKKALRCRTKRPRIGQDEIWRYQILLRKTEYYTNCKRGVFGKVLKLLYHYRYRRLGRKLGGFCISPNSFGPGLSIAHWGAIVVHPNARIGKNCRIHEGVTIGATNGSTDAAKIGDNVFIASGAKIIGGVTVADDVAVGANAVVVKDIEEAGITVGGVPAKKISGNNSHANLSEMLVL